MRDAVQPALRVSGRDTCHRRTRTPATRRGRSHVALRLALLLVASRAVAADQPRVPPPSGDARVPLTIEVRRDVVVRRDGFAGQRRGVLYADTSFMLPRGARLEMIGVGREGGCRLRYAQRIFKATSCPWLPGFTDHQRDMFRVVMPPPPSP